MKIQMDARDITSNTSMKNIFKFVCWSSKQKPTSD